MDLICATCARLVVVCSQSQETTQPTKVNCQTCDSTREGGDQVRLVCDVMVLRVKLCHRYSLLFPRNHVCNISTRRLLFLRHPQPL